MRQLKVSGKETGRCPELWGFGEGRLGPITVKSEVLVRAAHWAGTPSVAIVQMGEGSVLLGRVEENSSGRSPYPEFLSGILFLLTGLALLTVALLRLRVVASLLPLLFYLSGLLQITAAGFLSAFLTAGARRGGARNRRPAARHAARTLHPLLDKVLAHGERLWLGIRAIDWMGDWLAVLTVLGVSLITLFTLSKGWHLAPRPTALADQMTVGIL